MLSILCLVCPILANSQVQVKAGFTAANRWNETLNSQTLGKGFRLSGEKLVAPKFGLGIETAYLSFHPTDLVAVQFNTLSLSMTYYLTDKRLEPYLGAGLGFARYADKTTIELGAGNTKTQTRHKNYGVIAPFLGVQYAISQKAKNWGVYLQANADIIPVVNITPIGFVSLTTGICYKF